MSVTRRDRIERIIKGLEEQMRALKAVGLHDCASLVRIAWLDLRRRNDRISIRELQALCDRVTDNQDDLATAVRDFKSGRKPPRGISQKKAVKSSVQRPATGKRSKKSAHIIDIQAWRSRIPRSQ